jgi:hypothetical protein
MKEPLLGLLAQPSAIDFKVVSRLVDDELLSAERICAARLIDRDLQSVGLEAITIYTKVLTETYDDQ